MPKNLPSDLVDILDFIDDYENETLDEDIDLGEAITNYRQTLNQLRAQYEGDTEISETIDTAEQSLDAILDNEGIPTVEDSDVTIYDIARMDDRSDD